MRSLKTKDREGLRIRMALLVSALAGSQLTVLGSTSALGQASSGAAVPVVRSEKKNIPQSVSLENKARFADGSPMAFCAGKAEKGEFSLPGEKGAVKLDKCYKGRVHATCVISAMKAESVELKTDYANLVGRKYPETRSLQDLCSRSMNSLRADADLARAFRVRFAALRDVYTSRISCAASLEKGLSNVQFVPLVAGDQLLKSMVGSFQSDMKHVVQDLGELNALSEKVAASAAALDALIKVHSASCELSKVEVDQSASRQTSTRRNSSASQAFSRSPM